MSIPAIIPVRLVLTIDDEVKVIDDSDDILAYNISDALIADKNFKHLSASGKLDFYDPRDPIIMRHIILDFEQEGKTKDTLFYRLTLSLVPLSAGFGVSLESEKRRKEMTSILLGYDLTPHEGRVAHFRYVWKEIMAKQKEGKLDDMTDEEKVLADLQDSQLASNYFNGRSLYLHKRYYEALLPLTDAFHTVTRIYDHHNNHVIAFLDELAYFIGCCYMCLHQYDRASYYLQLTLPTSHESYTEAYINCLVNGDDFRAMDILSSIQEMLQSMLNQVVGEGDDEEDEVTLHGPSRKQLEGFLNFVKRRRAYMLVNNGNYNEAEKLLKQLLDDPDNSDFALSELAYIQKHK